METMVWITENPLNVISFGIATYEFCKRMPNYRVIVLALGHEGVPLRPTQNFEILPLKSSEQLDYYMRKLSPEVTIVFHSYYFIKSIENISLCGKKLVYVPVEGDPLPMEVVPTLQTYDQIITPSEYSQRILKKAGLDARVVPHGVDTEFYTPRQKTWTETKFGYLGANDIRKQIPRVMEAYAKLGKGILTIASEGKGHYNLAAEAKTLGVAPIFIEKKFYGIPLTKDNVKEFYNGLDIYVSPATEAFGLPSLESAAMGVCNIALDHGASREILGNGAIYVKTSDYLHTNIGKIGLIDINDLYHKMRFLMDVPDARERTAQKGIERAKFWTWEKAIDALLEAVDNA